MEPPETMSAREETLVAQRAPSLSAPASPLVSEPLGRATILLVDSVEINRQLLKGILKAGPFRLLEARQPSDAFAILDREPVDLIIADLMLPEVGGSMDGGLDFCRRLKAHRRTRLIPILILTSVQGIDNEVAGLESGADEFLIKPLQPAVVRTRVRTMLRNKRTIDSLEEAETILFALAQTVEQRDQETGNHCQRLAALSVALGTALGLPEEDLVALYRGGYLHDIGKIAVPDAILFKRGVLNEEEWTIMRSHTWKGEEICHRMRSLAPVLPIIRNHHEKWDGSGYPDSLAGEQIPLLSRILQLADIYDALTSRRSYKSAYTPEEAVAMIQQEAAMGWRDPELVSVFVEMVREPNFVARSAALFAPSTGDPAEDAELQSMRESLARMSREVLK
ncbi:MAG: HD domain-containing protein [Acidobacteria bacterium]|nr:HD domain-containing protein [Acidobacteriota bacterium]